MNSSIGIIADSLVLFGFDGSFGCWLQRGIIKYYVFFFWVPKVLLDLNFIFWAPTSAGCKSILESKLDCGLFCVHLLGFN